MAGWLIDTSTWLILTSRTGYKGLRESIRTLMGDETIDRTCPVWGFDEEGEINGVCRPTGHPGVVFNIKDFRPNE